MTLDEVHAYCDGVQDRRREEARLAAWQVSTMVNLWSSDKVTVGQLLGEEERVDDVGEYDVDEALAEAREMREAKEQADADGWDEGLMPDEDEVAARMARLLEEGQ